MGDCKIQVLHVVLYMLGHCLINQMQYIQQIIYALIRAVGFTQLLSMDHGMFGKRKLNS